MFLRINSCLPLYMALLLNHGRNASDPVEGDWKNTFSHPHLCCFAPLGKTFGSSKQSGRKPGSSYSLSVMIWNLICTQHHPWTQGKCKLKWLRNVLEADFLVIHTNKSSVTELRMLIPGPREDEKVGEAHLFHQQNDCPVTLHHSFPSKSSS